MLSRNYSHDSSIHGVITRTSSRIADMYFFGIGFGPNRTSLLSRSLPTLSLPLYIVLQWCRNIQKNHPCRHNAKCRAAAHHSAPFLSSGEMRCVRYRYESMHKSSQSRNLEHGCGSYATLRVHQPTCASASK